MNEMSEGTEGLLKEIFPGGSRTGRFSTLETGKVREKIVDPLAGHINVDILPALRPEEREDVLMQVAYSLAAVQTKLEAQSIRDWHTGTYSRGMILGYAEQTMKDVSKHKEADFGVGVATFDLDEFSQVAKPISAERVNLAHEKRADQTVVSFCKVLESAVKLRIAQASEEGDNSLVRNLMSLKFGRIGGDEFVAVGRFANREQFEMILEILRSSVENNLAVDAKVTDLKDKLTASFGGVFISPTELTSPNIDIDKILQLTDGNLYWAKEAGRNRFRVTDTPLGELGAQVPYDDKVLLGDEIAEVRVEKLRERYLQYLMENCKDKDSWNNALTLIANGFNRLEKEARTDDLTGLVSRGAGLEAIDNLLTTEDEEAFPLAIGLIDIDWFKQVNDNAGHDIGDEALKATADEIQLWLDEYSSKYGYSGFAARFRPGGQFLLVVSHTASGYEGTSRLATERMKGFMQRLQKKLGQIRVKAKGELKDVMKSVGSQVSTTSVIVSVDKSMRDELLGKKAPHEGIIETLDDLLALAKPRKGLIKGADGTTLPARNCVVYQDNDEYFVESNDYGRPKIKLEV